MNDITYNILSFIIEFLKLYLTTTIFLRFTIKSNKKLTLSTIMAIFFISIACNFINIAEYSIIYGLISIILLCLFTPKIKFKFGYICLGYISICLVDMIFSIIFFSIFNFNPESIQNSIWMILINAISLFILFFISIIILFFHRKNNTINLTAKQILTFILLGISSGVYISFFQLFQVEINMLLAQRIALIGLSISIAVFIGVCASLIISDNENKNLKFQNEINLKLLQQQRDYYIMLLNKDEETKKFRHDISNHIYCMHILFRNREYEKLDNYFFNINQSLSSLKTKIISGNNLIDSIINDQLSKYDNIDLHWNGHIPSNLIISDMVLCTIFSNLISNAFEASSKANDKNVYVNVKMLTNNLYLNIENSFDNKLNYENNKLISSKAGLGHGYGVENMIKCLNENNGLFEWHVKDNIFKAEVIFMNAINID